MTVVRAAPPLRVLVVEARPVIRDGAALALGAGGIEVAAQCTSLAAAQQAVARERPDVVVVGARFDGAVTNDGVLFARRLRRMSPGQRVVVLAGDPELHHLGRLLESGAEGLGYLLEERVLDAPLFARTVRRVAGGGTAIDPEVVTMLLRPAAGTDVLDALDADDRRLLARVVEGLPPAEAGDGAEAAALAERVAAMRRLIGVDGQPGLPALIDALRARRAAIAAVPLDVPQV